MHQKIQILLRTNKWDKNKGTDMINEHMILWMLIESVKLT